MNAEKKEALKQVSTQLDNIYNNVVEVCKYWEVETAPIITIEEFAERNMIQTEKLKGHSLEFSNNYNMMLERLIHTCRQRADEMGTNKIPLPLFKSYIELLKDSFKEGLEQKTGRVIHNPKDQTPEDITKNIETMTKT